MTQIAPPSDGELTAFVENLRQLRSSLSPAEQHLLDAVLLTAAGEDAAVQGYGLDGTAAKRAAIMAVVALGLTVGGMSSPGAGTAHASEMAQGGGRHGSGTQSASQGISQRDPASKDLVLRVPVPATARETTSRAATSTVVTRAATTGVAPTRAATTGAASPAASSTTTARAKPTHTTGTSTATSASPSSTGSCTRSQARTSTRNGTSTTVPSTASSANRSRNPITRARRHDPAGPWSCQAQRATWRIAGPGVRRWGKQCGNDPGRRPRRWSGRARR